VEQLILETRKPNQFNYPFFLDYIRIVQRKKWVIVITLALIIFPITLITYLSAPVYESMATLIYEEPKDTMFALDMGQPFYTKSATINMIEMIMSRNLAIEVANVLPQQVIDLFEFPDPLPPDFSQQKFIAEILQKNLAVESIQGSDILKIKIQANHPEAAKIIANYYVDRIINWNLQKKRKEITSVRSFIENQLVVTKEKLSGAEEALQNYRERNEMVSLSRESTEILNRTTSAEVAYNQAKAEREALEQRIRYINQKKIELAPTLTISNNGEAQSLKEQLLELEVKYSALQYQGIAESSQQLQDLKQHIEQLKQKIVSILVKSTQQENLIDPFSQVRNLIQESITLDVDLETYKAREQSLKKIIDNYNDKLQTLPLKELQLARLVRDKEVNDKIYSTLLEKGEEARITEASKVGDIQIIDEADAPKDPIKPKKKRNIGLAVVLGFGLGIVLAIFLDSLDTSLKSQEDIEKYLNLSVLSSIPTIQNQNDMGQLRHPGKASIRDYSKKLLYHFNDVPHLYEAYKNLMLNFSFYNTDKNIKSIIITSAGASEGKSLTSINMALMFSRNNIKTLLIDCDLRKPKIHKILNLEQEPGLTNVLIDKADLDKSIINIGRENFYVLPSGLIPPNPSDLLNTKKMENILTKLKHEYTFIILDLPPVIAVTDPIILGNKVDGVCLVIRSGKTTYEAAFRAKKILENSGVPIIGTILNDVNFRNVYGYYKDYYYYSHNKRPQKFFDKMKQSIS
jgi:capsular exopolysaccharide synthesis family protein